MDKNIDSDREIEISKDMLQTTKQPVVWQLWKLHCGLLQIQFFIEREHETLTEKTEDGITLAAPLINYWQKTSPFKAKRSRGKACPVHA